jgi:hypothetical protein
MEKNICSVLIRLVKEAMFFSNEEHNLMIALPDGRFIKLFWLI